MAKNRVLDISKAAALQLDMVAYGVEKIKYRVLDSVTSAYLLDTLRNARYEPTPVKKTIKPGVKPVVNPVVKTADKTPVKTSVAELKNRQILDKNLKICKPSGYGVQVGYYKIKSNCLGAIVTYEKTYKTQGYFWVEQFTHVTYYHLIMGNFSTKEEAEKLRQQIIKNIPGCFVMNWNKI